MTRRPDAAPKPGLAMAIATSLGLGYLPKAPGTWGSLAGVVIYGGTQSLVPLTSASGFAPTLGQRIIWMAWTALPITLLLALAGIWAAHRAADYAGKKDPQFVVIDEVSGQHLTYLLSLTPLNWKYMVAGFILFRAFDIWKPFPARQAESLHGGLGIMADDWIAGAYAALALGLARYLGL